jgi:HAD superfamily hydrolase (TIGR01549 family)
MVTEKHKIIQGKLVQGRGEAKGFMQVDWVREQCLRRAGFDPFPGTLNLKVSLDDFNFIRRLSCARGERLIPPAGEDGFCEARLLSVRAGDVSSALVFPMVDHYYSDILEIVAPVGLKRHLRLSEGDLLQLSFEIPEKLPAPAGIIFDLDGTLIDSVDLYYSILCEGCQELGLDRPPREKVLDVMGRGTGFWEAWEELMSAMELDVGKEELREKCLLVLEEIWQRRYDREVKFFPGAVELLSRLQAAGIRMGIVTSSFYKKKMNLFTENSLDPSSLFRSVITRSDTLKNKPNPEPVQQCLQKLEVPEAECICVGDSPCDIVAGREAGLITVGVLTGTGTRQSLSKEGADAILDAVTELPEVFDLNLHNLTDHNNG